MEIRPPKTNEEWINYYSLRYEVLRKPLGKPEGSEKNEGDLEGIHFALYQHNDLKAIARLDKVDENTCQVRFVAVSIDSQGKGYGKAIMESVEERAKLQGYQKIILHARDNAVGFYSKMDYSLKGESYKLFDVLQHYLMEKKLN